MSCTPTAGHGRQRETEITDGDRVEQLLEALEDSGCRAILQATVEESLSASELSDACSMPLSTTYRKLDTLTEAGLLEEQVRISSSGKHTSEYSVNVTGLGITITAEDGVTLTISDGSETEHGAPLLAGAD